MRSHRMKVNTGRMIRKRFRDADNFISDLLAANADQYREAVRKKEHIEDLAAYWKEKGDPVLIGYCSRRIEAADKEISRLKDYPAALKEELKQAAASLPSKERRKVSALIRKAGFTKRSMKR